MALVAISFKKLPAEALDVEEVLSDFTSGEEHFEELMLEDMFQMLGFK
jgi:hypothetical protein